MAGHGLLTKPSHSCACPQLSEVADWMPKIPARLDALPPQILVELFASKRWPNVLLRHQKKETFFGVLGGDNTEAGCSHADFVTLECNSQIQQLSQTCLVGKESCFCLARRVNMECWKWHTTTTPKVEAERCSCVSCTIA